MTIKFKDNPGMMLVITYIVLLFVNSLVILVANSLFPMHVVLGTLHIPRIGSVILSMGTLSLVGTFAIPFIREYENKRDKMFSDKEWMFAYLIINFVGVWGVARFADQLGLGIASWIIALLLAIAFDIVQGIAMMQVEKMRKS